MTRMSARKLALKQSNKNKWNRKIIGIIENFRPRNLKTANAMIENVFLAMKMRLSLFDYRHGKNVRNPKKKKRNLWDFHRYFTQIRIWFVLMDLRCWRSHIFGKKNVFFIQNVGFEKRCNVEFIKLFLRLYFIFTVGNEKKTSVNMSINGGIIYQNISEFSRVAIIFLGHTIYYNRQWHYSVRAHIKVCHYRECHMVKMTQTIIYNLKNYCKIMRNDDKSSVIDLHLRLSVSEWSSNRRNSEVSCEKRRKKLNK